jgi:hypothetical protein
MRERCGVLVLVTWIAACAAPPKSAPSTPPSTEPAARSAAAETARDSASVPALSGRWVEFWALNGGGADTQCYAFFDDGRFGWHAAATGSEPDSRRWGHYRIEGGALLLSVEGHEQRSGCEGTACRLPLGQPEQQQLPLGECPANEEAKNLDPAYVCVSIAGHAFWRDAHTQPDPAAYIP